MVTTFTNIDYKDLLEKAQLTIESQQFTIQGLQLELLLLKKMLYGSRHEKFMIAAATGAWISLDGIGWGDFDNYADSIEKLQQANLLHRVLISHDAGWYKPGEPEGGKFTGYTNIFTQLLPLLKNKGFTKTDIEQLLVKNPAEAFAISG